MQNNVTFFENVKLSNEDILFYLIQDVLKSMKKLIHGVIFLKKQINKLNKRYFNIEYLYTLKSSIK